MRVFWLMLIVWLSGTAAYAQDGLSPRDMISLVTLPPAQFEAQWDKRRKTAEAAGGDAKEIIWLWAAGLANYPYFHWRETGEAVPDDWEPQRKAYAVVGFDDPAAMESAAYRQFLGAWSHDQAGKAIRTEPSLMTGDNRWLRARFFIIDRDVTSPVIATALRESTLSAHIDDNGARGIGPLIDIYANGGGDGIKAETLRKAAVDDDATRALSSAYVYKSADGIDLYAHVFKPEPLSASAPVVIWFHGGSFDTGHWSYCPTVCRHLQSLGFVVVQVEYRTSQRFDSDPLDILADSRDAVTWVQAHASKLGIDKDRIIVAGFSSGATVASQLVLSPDSGPDSGLAGAVLMSGCYDLTQNAWYNRVVSPKADVAALSAVNAWHKGAPPLLVLHSPNDDMCAYKDALTLSQHDNALIRLESFDGGHFFIFRSVVARDRVKAALTDAARDFGWTMP